MKNIYALVFSDTHLGSKQSTTTIFNIVEQIKKYNAEKVIFIGDIVDLYVNEKNIKYYEYYKKNL